ncbi:MAG: helix-hairpin-helix domain-containing protein [Promethearchaeia archaeon]
MIKFTRKPIFKLVIDHQKCNFIYMPDDLTRVKGIGVKAAELLKAAGITTIEALAKSNIENLVKIKGIGPASAKKWINNAIELLKSNNNKINNKSKANKSAPKGIPAKTPKKSVTTKKISSTPKKTTARESNSGVKIQSTSVSKITSSKPTYYSKSKQIKSSISTTTKSETHKIEIKDTAEPIPRFLLNRLSKKALKILNMSYTAMKRENLKNLENYLKILEPERIKFDPAFQDEKNALIAIDEKIKFIESLIINYRENEIQRNLEEYIVKPMERNEFKLILDRLSENFGPEQAAIKIFDGLSKKVKKILLKNTTEIANIRDIQKIIEEKYPDKAKLYYQKHKR